MQIIDCQGVLSNSESHSWDEQTTSVKEGKIKRRKERGGWPGRNWQTEETKDSIKFEFGRDASSR